MTKRVALSRGGELRRERRAGRRAIGLLALGGAAIATTLAGFAMLGGEASAQTNANPRVSGRPISACIQSTRFPNRCSPEAQFIIANQFCRTSDTAPVVSFQVGNGPQQDLSVLEEQDGDRTKGRWVRNRGSGQIFTEIVCTDASIPDRAPADNTPPPDRTPPTPPDRTPPRRPPPVNADPPPATGDEIDENRLPGMRRERR